MEILKSSGMGQDAKKTRKGKIETNQKAQGRKPQPRLKPLEEDIQDDAPASADVDMLDSLTGCPHEEDELLFAVPVIAPYQTLHSYKLVFTLIDSITVPFIMFCSIPDTKLN